MAIGKRISDSFDLVYLYDPALNDYDQRKLADYHRKGRNIEDLDIDSLIVKPTIFQCMPPTTADAYWLDAIKNKENESLARWELFKRRVRGVKNGGDMGITWEETGERNIEEKCRDSIYLDVVDDISEGIRLRAVGDASVFSLPVDYLAKRSQIAALHALRAATKEPTSAPANSNSV